jgi:hypothetical protein
MVQNTVALALILTDTRHTGSSVAVYGIVPNNTDGNSTAAYTIDGVSTVLPIPSGSNQVQGMSEFFNANLEPGTHTLLLNVTEVAPGHVFGIDFVLYNSSVETSPAGSTVQAPVASSRHTNRTRTIVGATLGALAGLALLGLIVFLYLKPRSRKTKSTSKWDVISKANQ